MLMIRAQSQFDQCASIGRSFGLPVVVGLITLHGLLRSIIPHARRFARQVVLTNQSLLDFQGALPVNLLLSTRTPAGSGFPRPFARAVR
jgi:hypothetical protein